MQTEEFKRWCRYGGEGEGDNGVLFCHGNPGVGKTFIRYNKDYPPGEERELVLTSCDGSSLVVDRLCEQAGGQTIALSYFYFDFVARKEQSAISMLGSLVKQMVRGMERIPEEVSRVFRELGGCRPKLVDIAKILQAITFPQPTFICIDALDECEGVQRDKILSLLKQILEKSPGTRIFVTGRPHIRSEIEKCLAGRVINVRVGAGKEDITTFLCARLGKDETSDAMDDSLEADILAKIPENISEMCVGAMMPQIPFLLSSDIYI